MESPGTKSLEKISSETEDELSEPPLYKVLLHNDDFTTMEFVVNILLSVFNKSVEEATQIMLNVHNQGIGLCGLYSFEVAETKVEMVSDEASRNGFPLRCSMEKE
ncbi:MAG: ATP-dependent Clp protease adapter ClpS [Desulfobacterales bacterium]|jgi:ATP-dependent Clp protease adaptor protein ClpS|nr:ATP-dependent Clp protease adapter ClpS [Desulfobacteraceae bacterium]MBT7697702.1 ATP-dependent Clp protease adapter ClpS [Desulfobacterales bacterium]